MAVRMTYASRHLFCRQSRDAQSPRIAQESSMHFMAWQYTAHNDYSLQGTRDRIREISTVQREMEREKGERRHCSTKHVPSGWLASVAQGMTPPHTLACSPLTPAVTTDRDD